MENEVTSLFVEHSAKTLRNMTDIIERCLARLDDEQLWTRGDAHENSIGNLILHLSGNVRQVVVTAIGGAPDTRDRDAEFATQGGLEKQELLDRLRKAVDDGIQVIEHTSAERMAGQITVQNRTFSVLGAIYHAVGHFQQHTGQIIFATKILCGEDLGLQRPARR